MCAAYRDSFTRPPPGSHQRMNSYPVDPRMTPQRFVGGAEPRGQFIPHFPSAPTYNIPRRAQSPMQPGVFTDNIMRIPHRPFAGVPFQPHYSPHLNSGSLAIPPVFNIPPMCPPGMNIPPLNRPGTYFNPSVHTAPLMTPLLSSPTGPFGRQGLIMPPDPTDMFLSRWLSSVTASCHDRQRMVQEDRPMKVKFLK